VEFSKPNESQLLIALSEAIKASTVTSYTYASFSNEWETRFKEELEPEFRKALYKHLDFGGLSAFLKRELSLRFIGNGEAKPESGKSKALTKYASFSDPLRTASELTSQLQRLPLQYEMIFPFCENFFPEGYHSPALQIDNQLGIESGETLIDRFIQSSGDENTDEVLMHYSFRNAELSIDTSRYYFVFRTSGALSDIHETKIVTEFSDSMRAFYGALMSFNIVGSTYFSFLGADNPYFLINELGKTRQFAGINAPDSDIKNCTDLFTTKTVRDELKSGKPMDDIFELPVRLFNSNDSTRLKIASTWLCRGHLSLKPMDKVIESTIALEVMLGDRDQSDRVGLSKLMANRCAYALAKSSKERVSINKFFVDFYKLRSDIVHTGQFNLSRDDYAIVKRGLDLASRMLLHETQMS
jgi:hypothetical protein